MLHICSIRMKTSLKLLKIVTASYFFLASSSKTMSQAFLLHMVSETTI